MFSVMFEFLRRKARYEDRRKRKNKVLFQFRGPLYELLPRQFRFFFVEAELRGQVVTKDDATGKKIIKK